MGKLKKGRRNQRGRHNPVARKNGGSKQDTKDENTRQNKIVPLIAKLTSAAPNDRSMALSAITVLAEDTRMRRMLLKERLVATVMEQCLNDSNDEIVVEAFGLLRNLTIEEGHEVAKFLWRSNVWAAIESGLQKIQGSFEYMNGENKKLEKKRAYLLYDFTENMLSLVVAIASCSDELYENVYSRIELVVKLVVDLLKWNSPKLRTTTKLYNALLEFIYEFASDSADFINDLVQYPAFSLNELQEAINTPPHEKNLLGKVYVQGIQFHLYEVQGSSENNLSNTFAAITTANIEEINDLLATPDNAQAPVTKLKEAENNDEKPQNIDVPFGGDSPEKSQAKSDLQAIDVAIDIFTTICEYLAINEQNLLAPVRLSEEILDTLLNLSYPALLHLLAYDQEHSQSLQISQKVLIALNNLCWLFLSSETIPVAWFERIPQLWDMLEKASQTDNLDTLKLCLSVFWALSKTVGAEIRDKISSDSVNALLSKCGEILSQIPESEEHLTSLEFILSAAGFLGTIAQTIGNAEITRSISEFLLAQIGHFAQEQNNGKDPKAIEIALESLNLIYDIFGDAEFEYDYPVFVEGDYISRLTQLEPQIKVCYKQIDKKKNSELKLRAEETWTNLNRFIEYKKSERS
ncbi:CIC11C00000002142 [Sungouiella intermedia]|uniref:CIC11C00000002142 n=1 Tax=Sungouiella intermedia TaxID=45354 RepID=A0A1L0DCX2_9ASCO|nr:CIC11C00000002142 [[Candida] intermedia]